MIPTMTRCLLHSCEAYSYYVYEHGEVAFPALNFLTGVLVSIFANNSSIGEDETLLASVAATVCAGKEK